MNKKFFWLSILAVLISFAGGFLLANSLNRNDLNRLRAENERLKKNTDDQTLTTEEIEQRIREAEQNPDNFGFQKNLGLALYRYAALKQDASLMRKISPVLERAAELRPEDYDVLVALGNLYFDIGYLNKENEEFLKARNKYQKALEIKPEDVDVRTDFGLTYFLIDPPEVDRAVAEFKKSLENNPDHQKTLQVLTEAYINKNSFAEAEQILNRLKKETPGDPLVQALEKKLQTAAAGAKE